VRSPIRRLRDDAGREEIRERHLVVGQQRRGAVAELDRREAERPLSKLIDEIRHTGPHENVGHAVGKPIAKRVMLARRETGEGVRKGAGRRPRHREDHVQRDVQGLGAMEMAVARRVRNDPIGDERLRVRAAGILLGARRPRRFEDVRDDLPFSRYVFDDLLSVRGYDAPAGLDHVLHELARIAGERVELQPRTFYEGSKLCVGGDPHSMAPRQTLADRNERLYVAARPDDQHDDVEARGKVGIGPWLVGPAGLHRRACQPMRGALEDAAAVIELELQAVVVCGVDCLQRAQRRHVHALVVETSLQKRAGHRVHHASAGLRLRHDSRSAAAPRRGAPSLYSLSTRGSPGFENHPKRNPSRSRRITAKRTTVVSRASPRLMLHRSARPPKRALPPTSARKRPPAPI